MIDEIKENRNGNEGQCGTTGWEKVKERDEIGSFVNDVNDEGRLVTKVKQMSEMKATWNSEQHKGLRVSGANHADNMKKAIIFLTLSWALDNNIYEILGDYTLIS